jgi:MoxR-like ATPase
VPADLVGTRIYNQRTGDRDVARPVFTHLLLADDQPRAGKVQSALLEVMQEYVTIAGNTHRVPEPFQMHTQNPIETEGTYPLPEAGRPFHDEGAGRIPERRGGIRHRAACHRSAAGGAAVATTEQLAALQRECRQGTSIQPDAVRRAPGVGDAAAGALRAGGHPEVHPTARAQGDDPPDRGRARAFARRTYVLPEDVRSGPGRPAPSPVLTYEALAEGLSADQLIMRVMQRIPALEKPLETHVRVGADARSYLPARGTVIRRLDGLPTATTGLLFGGALDRGPA